jgi:hypothetical protein
VPGLLCIRALKFEYMHSSDEARVLDLIVRISMAWCALAITARRIIRVVAMRTTRPIFLTRLSPCGSKALTAASTRRRTYLEKVDTSR